MKQSNNRHAVPGYEIYPETILLKKIRSASGILSSEIETTDSTTPDMDALIEFSEARGLSVDLALHLKNTKLFDTLSPNSKGRLEARLWQGQREEAYLKTQVLEIVEVFESLQIEYSFLKGVALIVGGYTQAPGQRRHKDIDIQVQANNIDQAHQLLLELGYSQELTLPQPITAYWSSKHLPPYYHSTHPYRVEMHLTPLGSTMAHRPPYGADELLAHRESKTFSDTKVWVPRPEHILLGAFFHTQIHDGCDLIKAQQYKSYLDFALVCDLTAGKIDWQYITRSITSSGLEKPFWRFIRMLNLNFFSLQLNREKELQSVNISAFSVYRYSRNNFFWRTLLSLSWHLRTILFFTSGAGKLERRALHQANPENWKYIPFRKQVTSPALIKRRAKVFFNQIL